MGGRPTKLFGCCIHDAPWESVQLIGEMLGRSGGGEIHGRTTGGRHVDHSEVAGWVFVSADADADVAYSIIEYSMLIHGSSHFTFEGR